MPDQLIPAPSSADLARDPLADLKVCDAAPRGPWSADYYDDCTVVEINGDEPAPSLATVPIRRGGKAGEVALFIELARTACPAWIRVAEHHRRRAEALREAIAAFVGSERDCDRQTTTWCRVHDNPRRSGLPCHVGEALQLFRALLRGTPDAPNP